MVRLVTTRRAARNGVRYTVISAQTRKTVSSLVPSKSLSSLRRGIKMANIRFNVPHFKNLLEAKLPHCNLDGVEVVGYNSPDRGQGWGVVAVNVHTKGGTIKLTDP